MGTDHLLAVEAGGGFLAGHDEEGVGHLWACLEGAVDPEWPPTPDLLRRSRGHGVGHSLCGAESGAVVGDMISTLLVEVLVTSWERERERGGEGSSQQPNIRSGMRPYNRTTCQEYQPRQDDTHTHTHTLTSESLFEEAKEELSAVVTEHTSSVRVYSQNVRADCVVKLLFGVSCRRERGRVWSE